MPGQVAVLHLGCRSLGGQTLTLPGRKHTSSSSFRLCAQCSGVENNKERSKGLAAPKQQLTTRRHVLGVLAFLVLQGRSRKDAVAGAAEYVDTGSAVTVSDSPFSSEGGFSNFFRLEAPPPPPPPVVEPVVVEEVILDIPEPLPATSLSVETIQDQGSEVPVAPASVGPSLVSASGVVASRSLSSSNPQWSELGDLAGPMGAPDVMQWLPAVGIFGAGALVLGLAAGGGSKKETLQEGSEAHVPVPDAAAAVQPVLVTRADVEEVEAVATEGFFEPDQEDWNRQALESSRNSPAPSPSPSPRPRDLSPPAVALEERGSERFLGGVPNDLGMIMRFESEEEEIERMRQQLEVQIAENMDQLAAVTASAEAARAKELALEEDLMRRRADILSVQGHMEGLEQLLTDTTTSLLLKEEEAAQLASQLASASEELRERDAGMASLRAQLAGVQAALAEEQGSKEDLAVQLASSLDAFEAMAAEAEALEEQLRESSFAVEALEQQLAGAWRDAGGPAAELAGTLEREAAAQARVGRQLEASRAELVGHAGTAAALQAQLTASLRGAEGSLEALAAALEGPIAGARPLLQSLRQALQVGAPGEDRSAAVEAAVTKLARTTEDAALVPTLRVQIDSLLEEVRAGSAARQRITRELSHMRQALIEKTGDTEAMKAQLAVSARAAAQLEEQLAAGLRSASVVPGLKDKVQQLGQALSVARERKAATAAELAHTRAALVAKTGQVEELKATNAMLEGKLASVSRTAAEAPRLQERLSALLAELEGEQQLRARLVAELEWARGSVAASSSAAEEQRGRQSDVARTVEGLRAELAAVLEEAAAEPALRRRIEQLAESLASGAASSAAAEGSARGADAELALLVDGLGVEPALRTRLAALLQGLSAVAEEHARLGQALVALRADLAARAGDAEALKAQHGASSRALEQLAGRLGGLGAEARGIPAFKEAAGQLVRAIKADGVAGAGAPRERLLAAAARVPGLEVQVAEVLAALESESEARARVGRELAWARQDLVERAGAAEELKQQLAARGQQAEQLRAELAAALAGAQLVPALQAKVAALAEAKARVARELAFTRGALAARTGENTSLRSAVARMEEELSSHALAPRLEARVASLLQALAREGEQRRRVGRELAWAKQQLVARAGETQELKMQVAQRGAAIERLEGQVAEALSQARRLPGLEKQVARLGQALEAERSAKLRAGRELAYTRQALAAEQGDARTLRASLVTKEEEIRTLLAESGSAPRVRRQLEGALVALEEERAAKQRVAEELAHARRALAAAPASPGGSGAGALDGLRAELVAAQSTVESKEKEIGALREQLAGVGKDLAEKRRARDDVTGELEGLRTAMTRHSAEVAQLEGELAERHEEVERLTRQVEECQRALAVEQERSAQLQAEAAAAEEALMAEQSARAAAQEALEEQSRVLDAERNATSAARAVWQAKSRALETQLSSEKDEVLRLRRAVERAVATTYELQGEVKRLQEQLSAAKASDVGALEAELAAERATNARLQEELSRVQAALVRAKESVRTEMSHVAQMEAKLKLSRGESSALRNQVLDLGRSLRAAEAKLERLGTLGSSVGSWATMPQGDS